MNTVLLRALGLCFGLIGMTPCTWATEGPVGTPNGADGFLAGALPPPGTYNLAFGNHYRATRLNDGDGNSMLPGFKTSATVLADKVLHMTNEQWLGGQVGLYGAVALADIKVRIQPGVDDHRIGLLDPEAGVLVGWHGEEFHAYGLGTVVVPVGSYDKNRLINLTNNYWTLRPQFGWSYLPASGIDVSMRWTYSLNTRNRDTGYHSGQYLHADFNAGLPLAQGWKLGLQGYYLHQTTDDKLNGVRVGSDGNRARVLALGPGLFYQGKSASVEFKLLNETQARNRSSGRSAWLKVVWRL
jgi:hypothetical protein